MLSEKHSIFRFLLLIGLSFSIAITSCSKEDEPVPDETDQQNKAIAKKWVVNSASNARLKNNESDFLWFEFTIEGYYIILKKDLKTLTGTYTMEENSISLDGLGVLVISDISDDNFSFTFTANDSSESINIFTNEADKVIENSTRTELLCKTWTVKRQHGKIYGMDFEQIYPNPAVSEYTGVFSTYGTYVLSISYTDGTKQILNRLWQWKDAEETMICYGDTSSECNGENETTVLELTETSFNLHTVIPSQNMEIYDELVVFKK